MADDLQSRFEQAANDIKKLASAPSNDTLLELYALYKQGSSGDVSGKRPGMLKPVKRAKYDAWAKVKGKGSDDAKESYISLVSGLVG